MKELKEGVWMAQGPSQNVIIKAVGEAPFIKIISGIEMNSFFETGKVKELKEKSIEIQHIIQNPLDYHFEPLTVSESVLNAMGLGKKCFSRSTKDFTEYELEEITDAYRLHVNTYGMGSDNDNAFIVRLYKTYGLSVGEGFTLLTNAIKPRLQFKLQCYVGNNT